MALHAITVMKGIVDDIRAVCPRARIFNYTNPINIVSEALTRFTDIPHHLALRGTYLLR
ncbi:MAG: hypothetical protein OXH85_12560 [Truepera sp.]|nr:hypothetical protein [Truepera sp.]